jgi:hypothetical protein
MYCPERDFAYNYPRMVSCVIRAFNSELWPELLETLNKGYDGENLWDEVCQAKERFCQFLDTCCQDPTENVEAVLKRSGFLDLHPSAQIAWCAMLGQVMTGQLFQGIRDVTTQGEKHEMIIKLMQQARAAAETLNGTPDAAGPDICEDQFTSATIALRESGYSQQQVRDLLAKVFNREQDLV